MVLAGMKPAVLLVAALCGLIGGVVWFLVDLAKVVLDPTDVIPARPEPEPVGRADRRVMRLRSGLAYTRNGESLDRLHTTLVELVDDQLRAVYQIDRHVDPVGARAVLGDDLSTFVVDPNAARRLTRPSEVDHVLTLIEQI